MEMVSGEDPLFIDIEKWKGEEEDFEKSATLTGAKIRSKLAQPFCDAS